MANSKWQILENDQWRYLIITADVFATDWCFEDLMPPKLVDGLLGITPEFKTNLRIQHRNSYLCPECGASGFSVEYHYCPNCGKQMFFDDEEE